MVIHHTSVFPLPCPHVGCEYIPPFKYLDQHPNCNFFPSLPPLLSNITSYDQARILAINEIIHVIGDLTASANTLPHDVDTLQLDTLSGFRSPEGFRLSLPVMSLLLRRFLTPIRSLFAILLSVLILVNTILPVSLFANGLSTAELSQLR